MHYTLLNDDCFLWMAEQKENTITAIVTDPPYGIKEYTEKELQKQRKGKGGVWRLPPSFDGHTRMPVPRFSIINDDIKERHILYHFFLEWGKLAIKIVVPGGHLFIASTPLLSDIVSRALRDSGFERRGEIIRTVSTLRGGDRPKGAEKKFEDLSVLPRGLWEPWGLYRKPIAEKTIAKNLDKWNAGALRRINKDSPFCDLIQSEKTSKKERAIAPHPSIKPQSFMRKIVFAALPLGNGIIYDPFCGSGATLAAAEYFRYTSIGTEKDPYFYKLAENAIPLLAKL